MGYAFRRNSVFKWDVCMYYHVLSFYSTVKKRKALVRILTSVFLRFVGLQSVSEVLNIDWPFNEYSNLAAPSAASAAPSLCKRDVWLSASFYLGLNNCELTWGLRALCNEQPFRSKHYWSGCSLFQSGEMSGKRVHFFQPSLSLPCWGAGPFEPFETRAIRPCLAAGGNVILLATFPPYHLSCNFTRALTTFRSTWCRFLVYLARI